MSVSALEKLMFTVGITDMVSQPALSINKTITGMKQNATSGFDAIRGGMFGLAGAGIAIKTFMQPVYDVEKALGEVRSLGVIESEIKTLTKESLKFSMAYGESASDFIKSSYDIQSAIGGLTNGELAQFTTASNILAKGTKADAATITNYMGTMYGIFQDQANAMGKAQWVEQLTGQTAAAVQMFKTDGQQMSAAFTSIGANATASGVAINEQMAILGTLQSTMSGSEAGTKYKSFLAGVAGAQEKLGLQFTDSQGRLLPMLDIMDKLKGKFGNTFDEMEGLDLKKAFGSDEAVGLIKLLMGQTDGLAASMEKLGKINGMENAERMAKSMVDPWEQFQSVTEAVRIAFGTALMPTINDLLQTMGSGLQTLTGWTQEFPNITKWVGLLVLGMLGMSAATGLFSIVLGLGKTAMAAWGAGVLIFKALVIGLTFVFNALTLSVAKLGIAMIMNPMGLMIAGVIALVAGVVALAYWWDELYNMFAQTDFGAGVIAAFSSIWESAKALFSWLGEGWVLTANLFTTQDFGTAFGDWAGWVLDSFVGLLKFIFPWWESLTDLFNASDFGKGVLEFFDAFSDKFDAVKDFFGLGGGELDSQIDINETLAGGLEAGSVASAGDDLKIDVPKVAALQSINSPIENKDGLAKQLAKAMGGGGGASFGDVTINAEGGMSPENMETWGVMQGG
jgi:TP901 family phage tail tape measure protein